MAVELHMRKGDQGLIPATQMDWQLIQKLPANKPIFVRVFKPRSGKHHKKFFGMLGKAFRQQDRFTNEERFRAYVTCRAGHAEVFDVPACAVNDRFCDLLSEKASNIFFEPLEEIDGVRVMIPRSIAWDQMDQAEFNVFFTCALDVLAIEFEIDVARLEDENWGGRDGYGI